MCDSLSDMEIERLWKKIEKLEQTNYELEKQLEDSQAKCERLRETAVKSIEKYIDVVCAVWECPREEFEDVSHEDTLEEIHFCNKRLVERAAKRENNE